MGQKVSPIGMRVGVIRDWESRWYADKAEFGDLLNEDIKIRDYMEKQLKDAQMRKTRRNARQGWRQGQDGNTQG